MRPFIAPPAVFFVFLGVLSACGGGPADHSSGPAGPAGSGVAGAAAGGSGAPINGSGSGGTVSASAGTAPGTTEGGAGAGGTASAVSSGGALAGAAGAGEASGASGAAAGGAPTVCTGTPTKAATVYMIGDSTMSVYASNLYPRMGWGQPLGDLFAPQCATVVDKALSGRSSKSFFDEGAWTPVKDALKSGDYVLIQFGHNDEKTDAALFTDPQTTYKQYLTTYVNDARAKMATPILLTSINRNTWSGTTVSNSHGLYPAAVRELAVSLKVDLIDLTALTKAYFERLGQIETAKLFLILTAGESPNYPGGVTDNTHLQEKGARGIGQLAMADAYAQKLSIVRSLKAVPVAP